MGGETYGDFATGGEDSLTFIAFWSGVFIDYSTISVGDSQWTGFRSEGTEHFFNEDQTVQINTAHPEELSYFEYAVGDQFYSNGLAADVLFSSGHDHYPYTGAFNTASLNLEEGKPYVIYAQLGTKLLARYGVVCTEKIIIDKTAPAITGAKNGDVFCGEGNKTLTVTDRYLDTVTVNGVAVTPNDKGEITLTDARTPQTVVATDKAGNSTTLTVTVHSSHSYKWQTENGQYWGDCEFCGNRAEKKDLPTLTITSPDAVCRTQDFKFSFNLPEGCTNPVYSYEFKYTGDGEPITPVDGLCTGTIPAASYIAGETGFRFIASVTTAEGYRFSVSKDITIREHSGGTATCTEQAICDHCGQSYGALAAHSFTAETAEEQYLKSAATCTEKAVYYKSCAVCGTSSKGTADEATFESGKPLGHDWGAWMPDGEGTHKRVCTHDASHVETAGCTYGDWSTNQDSHWKTCTVCGGEAERLNHADPDCDHFCDTCGIKMTEHDFTGELPITALLYKEANCLSPALYYKSCKICMLSSKGTASEATFASGEKNPDRHAEDPGAWQTDADSHWRFYTCCHLEVDRGTHQGGTADCLAPALCEVCQHPYGELGPHHFVDQVNEYRLKSAATCTSPAVYYQSCSTCGAQGTETFTNGNPLGHDWGAWTQNSDEKTHTRICKRDTSHTETENCTGGTATCTHKAVCTVCGGEYGEMAAHSFTAEKAEAQYLKSAATCTEKAVYYKSCAACGTSSKGTADEATFFSGNALDHSWDAWTQNSDEKTHTRICKRDASHTETENCHGGTADCTHKAVCTVCGGEYGEMAAHSFTAEKAEEQYLKSAATCTEKAVYYKSCTACGLSSKGTADEATFFSGNALGHDWGAWTQNSDEKTHTRICKRDASHTETENCHGGTADCTHKAVCTVCGGEYGELDAKNHTNLKHFPAKAATKTTEGNIEYWYCSGCKKYYKDVTATQEIKQADSVTAKLSGGTVKPGADKSPQTGDNPNLLLWIALLFVSSGAAIGTTIVSRKKKYNR